MKILTTHDEVIAAIAEGLALEGVTYDQSVYGDSETESEEFPCGTSFCMLGAIATICVETEAEKKQLMRWGLDVKVRYKENQYIASDMLSVATSLRWSGVFMSVRPKDALLEASTFLSEQQLTNLKKAVKYDGFDTTA